MVIRVGRDHIKAGKQESSSHCPIAIAFHDAGFKAARVGPDCYWISGSLMSRDLPENAKTFIEDFDEGRSVKPFKFTIPNEA